MTREPTKQEQAESAFSEDMGDVFMEAAALAAIPALVAAGNSAETVAKLAYDIGFAMWHERCERGLVAYPATTPVVVCNYTDRIGWAPTVAR